MKEKYEDQDEQERQIKMKLIGVIFTKNNFLLFNNIFILIYLQIIRKRFGRLMVAFALHQE